mgnify:CR=1 FL=1
MAQEFVSSSVLSSGTWHKIKILEEGIYRIDYEQLEELGLQPGQEIGIYNNNFGILSYYNSDEKPDDLEKTAIHIERGQDGVFNDGDYILFYGNSTHRWKYSETDSRYYFARHHYSDTAVYFLKLNDTPVEIKVSDVTTQADYFSEASDLLIRHESEDENILKSGREWYEALAPGVAKEISHSLADYNLVAGTFPEYKMRVLARSQDQTVIRFNIDGETISSVPVNGINIFNTAGTYARAVTDSGLIETLSSSPSMNINFHNNGNPSARGWLDYLNIEAKVKNEFYSPGEQHFIIRDKASTGPGTVTEFSINTDMQDLNIWDISDQMRIKSVKYDYSQNTCTFRSRTDSLKKFIVFTLDNVIKPRIVKEPVSNQNIHSYREADMIIISHPVFTAYAGEIEEIHRLNDGLSSIITTPTEIYNEFSGGIPDISALKNFVKMIYSRSKDTEKELKYLLLFGDGSFENKTAPPGNPNFIPTYQTRNSHISILSFTSDDYYGLLDNDEGEYEGILDIGIGRLPVSDTNQARVMINKIKTYISPESVGPWRNIITMVADDEDNNIHMNDADNLSDIIKNQRPSFNIEKIYLDSYEQETSVNGDSYPEATRAINERVNNGCLIVNYAGHGNELGLAHERVVNSETINSWINKKKYPVFITATCEFSRFEDIDIDPGSGDITQKSSAGELVLLNPGGGAIALLTTTRIVYASHNYNLASNLYKNAFKTGEDGKGLTLGDIMRIAKINTGGSNKRNFTLLGDPALRLAYPWHGSVITDSINNKPVSVLNDTLKALSELNIKGHVTDNAGNKLNSFNGYVNTILFDKEHEISTLANDGGLPFTYNTRDRILFRGKARVTNGRFSINMLIPKDIDYTYGNGKLSYFATDSTFDYSGSFNEIIIGGFNNTVSSDTSGPEIRLFLNDTLFREGGITDANPVLLALLNDQGSINTTGTGIGHDLVAVLDDDHSQSIILNKYYENDLGTYKSGRITYPLSNLENGQHNISIKAWDNFNNSSTESLLFFVRDEEGLVLNKLLNYPNPFTNSTNVSFEHNRPGEFIQLRIDIISRSGRLVKTIETTRQTDGYRIDPIRWDARDNHGNKVAAGIYIYTVTIRTEDNEEARMSGRMIIL